MDRTIDGDQGRFPAFGYPAFRIYWFGGFLSGVGNWAQNVTIPFVLLQLTGSPIWVGAAVFVQLTAQMLAMIWGGRIADRFDRKTIILRFNLLMVVTSLCLALAVGSDINSALLIIVIDGCNAFVFGLQHPSWQSLPTDLVPKKYGQNAAHLTITKWQAARAVGPIAGGALLSGLGATWALGFNVLTFAIATIAMFRVGQLAPAAFTARAQSDTDFAGIFSVLKLKVIAVAVALSATIAVLGMPIAQLTSVLAKDVYHVGPGAYGALLSAFGIGSLVGAAALTAMGHRIRRSRVLPTAFAACGIAVLIAGTVSNYWIGIVAVALTGVSFAAATSTLFTAIQLLSPTEQRGRAIALYLVADLAGAALGVLIFSSVADVTSVAMAAAATGTILLAIAGLLVFSHARLTILD